MNLNYQHTKFINMRRKILKIICVITTLVGIWMIFSTPGDTSGWKTVGACLGIAGIIFLIQPPVEKKTNSLYKQVKEYTERHKYVPLYEDELLIRAQDVSGQHTIHFNRIDGGLIINVDGDRRTVFSGTIHHISQLEELMKIVN